MRYVAHSGHVLARGTPAGHKKAAIVGNDVSVSQDLIGPDDESRAGSSTEASAIPGCPVVRHLSGNFDFHH